MDIRLMIFGLPRDASREQIAPLVEPCTESRFELLEVPGNNDQAMAIVHLGTDQRLASRLMQRISRRRMGGRALAPWITALPWA